VFFHHRIDNSGMKVVEKDRVISGMLHDELRRCQEMLDSLERSLFAFPKGVISERKKRYKDKVYVYHCLKCRDGKKVINKHVASKDIPEIKKKLEQRKRIEKELRSYAKKIAYLNRVIGHAGKGQE